MLRDGHSASTRTTKPIFLRTTDDPELTEVDLNDPPAQRPTNKATLEETVPNNTTALSRQANVQRVGETQETVESPLQPFNIDADSGHRSSRRLPVHPISNLIPTPEVQYASRHTSQIQISASPSLFDKSISGVSRTHTGSHIPLSPSAMQSQLSPTSRQSAHSSNIVTAIPMAPELRNFRSRMDAPPLPEIGSRIELPLQEYVVRDGFTQNRHVCRLRACYVYPPPRQKTSMDVVTEASNIRASEKKKRLSSEENGQYCAPGSRKNIVIPMSQRKARHSFADRNPYRLPSWRTVPDVLASPSPTSTPSSGSSKLPSYVSDTVSLGHHGRNSQTPKLWARVTTFFKSAFKGGRPRSLRFPYRRAADEPVTWTFIVTFITGQVYFHFLLRLPSLYFSRVSRIFDEVHLVDMEGITEMAFETSERPDFIEKLQATTNIQASEPVGPKIRPQYKRLKDSWESFIDSLIREWETLNIVSVMLLSAILTILQITTAASDPVTRYAALFSLICALISLLLGCMHIMRFSTMRKTYAAAEWAKSAFDSSETLFWNVWVLLSMPAVWFTWSIVLFLVAIMSFVWRTDPASEDGSTFVLSSKGLFIIRIAMSVALGLGLVNMVLVTNTFRHYGQAFDEAWQTWESEWQEAKANEAPNVKLSTPGHIPPPYESNTMNNGLPLPPLTPTPDPLAASRGRSTSCPERPQDICPSSRDPPTNLHASCAPTMCEHDLPSHVVPPMFRHLTRSSLPSHADEAQSSHGSELPIPTYMAPTFSPPLQYQTTRKRMARKVGMYDSIPF